MKAILHIVLLSISIIAVKPWVLPVDKCRLDDSVCMLPAFQKVIPIFINGIPELGLEKLGQLDDISTDISGLTFSLKNGTVKGLKDTVMDSIKWNLKKKTINIEYHVACILNGHYTATGHVLILPIDGDGEMKVKLNNIFTKLRIDYEIEKLADGKDHIRPKKFSYQHEFRDGVEYHITNLFKGSKELSDNLLHFINENWKTITEEFGTPVVNHICDKLTKNVKKFFEKLAIEDIAII